MTPPFRYGLYEVVGLELEYMIVDRRTLDVRPVADRLIAAECGRIEAEVERGPIAWSNELAAHLIELKTNGPAARLEGVAAHFQANVARIDELLAPEGAMLLPTGMHPWMDPERELVLWPHENHEIYRAFDGIFGCTGHGWANLQSAHVNLPFRDDEEFARLHAAMRLVLPILPALAASSPIVDGAPSGYLDTRLEVYRANARRVPSVAGLVVPEPVHTRADYERALLGRIYDDLAPYDPEGVLRYEWVNARGAIARFDRGSIEIRVLDVQECPLADVAIAGAVLAVLGALTSGELSPVAEQRDWDTAPLALVLLDTIRRGDLALVSDRAYLRALGLPGDRPVTAGELWRDLVARVVARDPGYPEWGGALRTILDEGCLARRILRRLDGATDRAALARVYAELARCLATGTQLGGTQLGDDGQGTAAADL